MEMRGRKPELIEVGPAVRLFRTDKAAVAFGVSREKFEAFAVAAGVPLMDVEGEKYVNLYALEVVLFATLRPWKGESFALGDPIRLPQDDDGALMYEMKLATLRYGAAKREVLEKLLVEAAGHLKRRYRKGKRPFGARQETNEEVL